MNVLEEDYLISPFAPSLRLLRSFSSSPDALSAVFVAQKRTERGDEATRPKHLI